MGAFDFRKLLTRTVGPFTGKLRGAVWLKTVARAGAFTGYRLL